MADKPKTEEAPKPRAKAPAFDAGAATFDSAHPEAFDREASEAQYAAEQAEAEKAAKDSEKADKPPSPQQEGHAQALEDAKERRPGRFEDEG